MTDDAAQARTQAARDLTPIVWTDEDIERLATITVDDVALMLASVKRYGSRLLYDLLTAQARADTEDDGQ